MSASRPLLTITPVKHAELPSEETLLAEGRELIDSASLWKQGKTYHKKVKTYRRPKRPDDIAPWFCRISEHTPDEATFDQLWDKLGRNKAMNEQQFIPELRKATKIKTLSDGAEIWSLYYTFTPPLSPRVFTVLQVARLDADNQSPRSGIIISIPVDLSGEVDLAKLEEKGVRGRYASVESITEVGNGNIEWRMAASSSAGGLIPAFIAENALPSAIAKDVPHFFKWLHSTPPAF